jgi:hypothetical protein
MKKRLTRTEIEQEAVRMRALAKSAARRQIRYSRLAECLEEMLIWRAHGACIDQGKVVRRAR